MFDKWQNILDILVKLSSVPAALIMKVNREKKYIEVFVSAEAEGNPYKKGETAEYYEKCGLYCENVIRNQKPLLIPDALKDPDWDKNPDIPLGMISYLGYPVNYPDGQPFGTICILDNHANSYNEDIRSLMLQFKDLVESHIALIYQNHQLETAISEIKTLKGLIPICSYCKKIRDDDGFWSEVESYISRHSDASFTHGICPDCVKKLYPEIFKDDDKTQ